MALNLLTHHSPLTVSHVIGVPSKTLNRWKQKEQIISAHQEENTVNFISLPLAKTPQATEKEGLGASVSKPISLIMKLPGHLELIIPEQPIQQMMELIRALSEEFSS